VDERFHNAFREGDQSHTTQFLLALGFEYAKILAKVPYDQHLIAPGNQHDSAEISRCNLGLDPLICTLFDGYTVEGCLGDSRKDEPKRKQTEHTSDRER